MRFYIAFLLIHFIHAESEDSHHQSHINYSNEQQQDDGLPYSEEHYRYLRQETPAPEPPKTEQQQYQPQYHQQQHYRPFSEVPNHIKQIIFEAYAPQPPYINPYSFFYGAVQQIPYPGSEQQQQQHQEEHSESEVDYSNVDQTAKFNVPNPRGGVIYKDDNRVQSKEENSRSY